MVLVLTVNQKGNLIYPRTPVYLGQPVSVYRPTEERDVSYSDRVVVYCDNYVFYVGMNLRKYLIASGFMR